LFYKRVSIVNHPLSPTVKLTITTTLKAWAIKPLKVTVTWSITVLRMVRHTASKATTLRSMVASTISTSSTYTAWPSIPPISMPRDILTMWLVVSVLVGKIPLTSLHPLPPKAELSQVTIPMAKLTVVPRASLVVVGRLWSFWLGYSLWLGSRLLVVLSLLRCVLGRSLWWESVKWVPELVGFWNPHLIFWWGSRWLRVHTICGVLGVGSGCGFLSWTQSTSLTYLPIKIVKV